MEIAKYSEFDKASYNEAYQFKNEIELYKDFNAELAVIKTVEEAKKLLIKQLKVVTTKIIFKLMKWRKL
jgi:hypothetical protein